MKFLILIGCILFLIALFAVRYRREIGNLLHLWRVLKKMNQGSGSDQGQFPKPAASNEVPLVKCAGCETWTPQENSLVLKPGVNYCSADCLAKSARPV